MQAALLYSIAKVPNTIVILSGYCLLVYIPERKVLPSDNHHTHSSSLPNHLNVLIAPNRQARFVTQCLA